MIIQIEQQITYRTALEGIDQGGNTALICSIDCGYLSRFEAALIDETPGTILIGESQRSCP